MTVIGALSSFCELGEMIPHKRAWKKGSGVVQNPGAMPTSQD